MMSAGQPRAFHPKARPVLTIRPCELKAANAFVAKQHRHHPPVAGHRFSLGVWVAGCEVRDPAEQPEGHLALRMVGVAICGRPVGRKTALRGDVLEITRLCTDGTFNACSALYAACARAAEAMGYRRIQTFLLAHEAGASLKASGWRPDGPTPGKPWTRNPEDATARQMLLGGGVRNNDHPIGPKIRWVRDLRP